jgi:hypothetical protein
MEVKNLYPNMSYHQLAPSHLFKLLCTSGTTIYAPTTASKSALSEYVFFGLNVAPMHVDTYLEDPHPQYS